MKVSKGFKNALEVYKLLVQEELDSLGLEGEKANNNDILRSLFAHSWEMLSDYSITLKCNSCGEKIVDNWDELFGASEDDLNLNHIGCSKCNKWGDFKVTKIQMEKKDE